MSNGIFLRLTTSQKGSELETYWPPAVGYIETSSAIVKPLQPTMTKQTIAPYMGVTEPPNAIVKARVPATPAQLLQMFQPMQIVSSGPISRDTCSFNPRVARASFFSRISASWVSTSNVVRMCNWRLTNVGTTNHGLPLAPSTSGIIRCQQEISCCSYCP